MASYGDVQVGRFSRLQSCCRCCCGGLGMVRQKLEGTGAVFFGDTGTMVQKVLQAGETVVVDTNCVMAFAASFKLQVRRAGGIMGMVGGGEGIFNTTLTGPGLVVMQSMNELMFRQALVASAMIVDRHNNKQNKTNKQTIKFELSDLCQCEPRGRCLAS